MSVMLCACDNNVVAECLPALMNNYLIEFYGSRATVDWGEENWSVERELCVSETGDRDGIIRGIDLEKQQTIIPQL